MRKQVVYAAIGLLVLAFLGFAAEKARDIYNGTLEQRVDALASIQPGLGTVMIEYGNRFTDAYFAAKGGNWGLAQYQIKEATEIQEVGEITRPGKAGLLKGFEHTYLDPLMEAIEAQDWTLFQERFDAAVNGCNGCHAATGHPYIKYTLPEKPVEAYIDFNFKSKPKVNPEEGEEEGK